MSDNEDYNDNVPTYITNQSKGASRVGDTFLTQSQAVVNQAQNRKTTSKNRQGALGGASTKTSVIQKNVTIEEDKVDVPR